MERKPYAKRVADKRLAADGDGSLSRACARQDHILNDTKLVGALAVRVANWSGFPPAMRAGPRPWTVDPNGRAAAGLVEVQRRLRRLSPIISGHMSWLAVQPVSLRSHGGEQPFGALTMLRQLDWHVHHFDASSEAHPNYAALAVLPWYKAASIIHRTFRGSTGCKLEAWVEAMRWLFDPASRKARHSAGHRYTHLWFVDSDLDFRHFDLATFRALVAHRAPFISQPGVMAAQKGQRATDYLSLRASMSKQVTGRLRRCVDLEPVEVQLPLLDMSIVPLFYERARLLDPLYDHLQQDEMNRVASELAKVAASFGQPARPPGLVFDYIPVIHVSKVLLPSKTGAHTAPPGNGPQAKQCMRGAGPRAEVKERRIALDKLGQTFNLSNGCPWKWFRL